MCLYQDSVVPLADIFWSLVLVHGDVSQQWAGMILKRKWPTVTLKISLRGYSRNEILKDYLRAQACSRSNTWYNITTSLESIHNEKKAPPLMMKMSWRGQCVQTTPSSTAWLLSAVKHNSLAPPGSLLEMHISGLSQTCWIKSPFSQDFPGDTHAGVVWEALVCSAPLMNTTVGSSSKGHTVE